MLFLIFPFFNPFEISPDTQQSKDGALCLTQIRYTDCQTESSHFDISGRGSYINAPDSLKPERADLKRGFKHKSYSTLKATGGPDCLLLLLGLQTAWTLSMEHEAENIQIFFTHSKLYSQMSILGFLYLFVRL